MKKLQVSPTLALPLNAVTQTFAILGIRGSGKTNTAVVIVEEMLEAGAQVIIFDPTNAWWGLRYSKDGKSPAYSIPVLGNPAMNADIPLVETSGDVLAEFAVKHTASMILSLRHLSKGARNRFATEFLEKLYHLKGNSPSPVQIVLDEADRFVPQRVMPDIARLVGAVDECVRMGRNVGMGITLISQRPAVINKDVLSQAENVFVMRTLGKHDRKALIDWADEHESGEDIKRFIAELSGLKTGDCWLWSPYWLKKFERVSIRERHTFDSSKTPEFGEVAKQPKAISPVEIEELMRNMAETIEAVKGNGPAELKRRIMELQKELKAKPKEVQSAKLSDEVLTKAIQQGRDEATMHTWKEHQSFLGTLLSPLRTIGSVVPACDDLAKSVEARINSATSAMSKIEIVRTAIHREIPSKSIPQRRAQSAEVNADISGPEQRILNAIAWLNSIGVEDPEQTAVAFLARYTTGGGAFNNPRGRLNQRGYVEYVPGDKIRLTEEGKRFASAPDTPLDAKGLQSFVLERLPGPEQRILKVLIGCYPEAITNEECAAACDPPYQSGGGAYNNPRGRLRSLGLIEYIAGKLRAKPLLFLEER